MQSDISNRDTAQGLPLELVALLEFAPGETYFVNVNTLHISWMNRQAQSNLGYSPAQLESLGSLGFICGVTEKDLHGAIQSLLLGHSNTVNLQLHHRRQDQTEYPVRSQLQLYQQNGTQTLVMFAQDHTENMVLLSELENARMYLEYAPDATVVVDENGNILTSNAQTERLLGYSKQELVGKAVELLIPERFHASHIAHRKAFSTVPQTRAMGTGLNLYAKSKNGDEIPIEVSLNPIVSGKHTLVAAALRDMTERNAAEQALRASEARYRALFNSATDLIQSFDSAGALEFVNPAWLKAMGYNSQELRHLEFFDLVAPSSQNAAKHLMSALHSGSQMKDVRLTYVTKAGNELHLEGSASALTAEGKRGSYQAIFHDVTERTHYEASLRKARDEAEQATAGKSRFLAAASHDLRQPLQALRLYLSVMSRLTDSARQQEVIAKMDSSVDTMSELLDALLDISRLDSGAIQPELVDLSTDVLFENILTSNIQQANEKGITLRRVGGEYTIHSDPGLLARIIDNFVTNAIRYTESGGVTLQVEESSEGVVLSVIDTGVGIAADQLDRVFEEYYQLDNGVRDRKKGLGLGLSIVKHIAALLGHTVSVESVPGQGSVFAVTVPLGCARADEVVKDRQCAELKTAKPIRVLFVDDDEAIVDATTMLLETADMEVISLLDGDDAITALSDGERPDVLVSDYRLPGRTGVEVIQHAQKLFGIKLPAVLMSGDTSIEELSKSALPNCTLLRKPVDTSALIQLIENLARRDEQT